MDKVLSRGYITGVIVGLLAGMLTVPYEISNANDIFTALLKGILAIVIVLGTWVSLIFLHETSQNS